MDDIRKVCSPAFRRPDRLKPGLRTPGCRLSNGLIRTSIRRKLAAVLNQNYLSIS
jgi:hypothetical protein